MAIDWRLKVYDEAFANESIIDMGDAVESLPDFSVAGDGDCLEGNFEAVVNTLGIKPRSILILETNTDGAGWVARHRGVITQPGAKRSADPSSVKVVGHKHLRFEEKVIPDLKIIGGDVAAMVRSVASVAGNRPAGTSYDAAEIPDLSLSLGDRYGFGLETLKDFMDAMAATCPADTGLAPVTYGMKADGKIFFKRVSTSTTYQDGVGGVRVVPKELDAEDVCTRVTLLLADQPQPSTVISENITNAPDVPVKYDPVPLIYKYNSGNPLDAEKPIPVQIGEGVLAKQSASVNTTYTYQVTDPADALDSSLTTYAEFVPVGGVAILMLNDIAGHVIEVIISYESDAKEEELSLVISYVENGVFGGERSQCKLPLPPTSGPATAYLVGLVSTEHFDIYDASRVSVVLGGDAAGTYNVLVRDISVYKLDEALATRIAKSFLKIPAQEASMVIVPGLAAPVTRVTLTGDGTYDVARVSYGIDKDNEAGGVITTFHLGQAYDAEDSAQASTYKKRDAKSTNQAIAFRRKI
jgi:hypothetical protein